MELAQDRFDPLTRLDRRVLAEVQRGDVLHARLSTEAPLEARSAGLERFADRRVVVPERREVHDRMAKVGADLNPGDRDHLESGIAQALELVGDHLADDLIDAQRARELARCSPDHVSPHP